MGCSCAPRHVCASQYLPLNIPDRKAHLSRVNQGHRELTRKNQWNIERDNNVTKKELAPRVSRHKGGGTNERHHGLIARFPLPGGVLRRALPSIHALDSNNDDAAIFPNFDAISFSLGPGNGFLRCDGLRGFVPAGNGVFNVPLVPLRSTNFLFL